MKWFPIPLRYSIPVILILFSIIFGIYSFQHEMKWSYFRHENYEKQEAIAIGNYLSTMLEYLYGQGHHEIANMLVTQARRDPDLRLTCMVDENNNVLHASSSDLAKQQTALVNYLLQQRACY